MKSDAKLISVNVGLPSSLDRRDKHKTELLRRAIDGEALPESWRAIFSIVSPS